MFYFYNSCWPRPLLAGCLQFFASILFLLILYIFLSLTVSFLDDNGARHAPTHASQQQQCIMHAPR